MTILYINNCLEKLSVENSWNWNKDIHTRKKIEEFISAYIKNENGVAAYRNGVVCVFNLLFFFYFNIKKKKLQKNTLTNVRFIFVA